jgi:hypothetical protein
MIHQEIIDDYEETIDRITYYEESEDRAESL